MKDQSHWSAVVNATLQEIVRTLACICFSRIENRGSSHIPKHTDADRKYFGTFIGEFDVAVFQILR